MRSMDDMRICNSGALTGLLRSSSAPADRPRRLDSMSARAVRRITGTYGEGRSYNGAPVSNHHSGTDFGADEGAPVLAAAAGRVAFAGYLATRGSSVIVDHGAGVFTGYHHMSRIDVVQGAPVAAGTQVGAVGMTGLATGPHLHWELIVGGVNVDPVFWTYEGVAP